MRMEIKNDDDGTTEEIDIVFMLVSRTKKELANDWDDDTRLVEREKTYVYTDMDAAVHALVEVLSNEANHYSEMPEYFQSPHKDECDSAFESEAGRDDVERLEAALYKQHLLGRGEDEPDIIALWKEQQENDGWDREGSESYREFMTILKECDVGITSEQVIENARALLNNLISDTDWTVTLSRENKVRTVSEPHQRYFYKATVQLKVARSITKTMLDWDGYTEMINGWRYNQTKEGKKKIAEAEERHNDLMTYMGESGLTSYSVSEDGTYSMWRGE